MNVFIECQRFLTIPTQSLIMGIINGSENSYFGRTGTFFQLGVFGVVSVLGFVAAVGGIGSPVARLGHVLQRRKKQTGKQTKVSFAKSCTQGSCWFHDGYRRTTWRSGATHRGGQVLLQVVVLLLQAKVLRQEILVARSLLVQLLVQLLCLLHDGTSHFLCGRQEAAARGYFAWTSGERASWW